MKSFTIYLAATGEILRAGVTNIDDLSVMLNPGEALLEGVIGKLDTERVDIEQTPPAVVEKG